MSAKHTPGPWFTDEKHYSDKHRYVMSEHAPFLGTVAVVALGFAEAEANARLIATAPDLLEALTKLVEDLEMRSNWKRGSENGVVDCGNSVYLKARSAIAKARGAA